MVLPVSRLTLVACPANRSKYSVFGAFLLAVVNAGRYADSMSSLLSGQKPHGRSAIDTAVRHTSADCCDRST
jgi:hypothetical protein